MPEPAQAPQFPYDPVVEAFKRDVDRTLLRQNLRRTVEERIRNLQDLLRTTEELRRAGRAARQKP
jgi:hypothetical protein